MKILITSPSLDLQKNVSGISSVVGNIIEYGQNEYTHFELGSQDKSKSDNKLKKIWRLLEIFFNYASFVRQNNLDLVHMNVPCDTKGILRESVILGINKIFRKKIIVHFHGGNYISKKPLFPISYLFNKIIKKANIVIVLGKKEQQFLIDNYDFQDAKILPNSIDVNLYKHDRFYKDANIPLQILYLGRIEYTKGIKEIIKVIEKLKADNSNFRLVVCGDGERKNEFVDACHKILDKDFTYKGVVSDDDKFNVIKESDIFLLPSYFEGLPMALLEVMAAGVVPVVTSVGGMPDVVESMKSGILIPPRDIDALYTSLYRLLLDRDLLKYLSKNAEEQISEKHDIKHYIYSLERIYEECILS